MLKNRFLMAFAFVGLVGAAACAEDEPEVLEEPVLEEPAIAPIVDPVPVVVDPAVMPMDTMAADTMPM